MAEDFLSAELAAALSAHDACAGRVTELRAKAAKLAADLKEAQAEHEEARPALNDGLGRAELEEIDAESLVDLRAAHDATSERLRALTSASNLVLGRIKIAMGEQAIADARLKGVAATDAQPLIADYAERANLHFQQGAEMLSMAFELEALARSSTELASGENAAKIGGKAHDVLERHGVGAGRGLHGSAFLGPAPGTKSTMTPRALLEMIESN